MDHSYSGTVTRERRLNPWISKQGAKDLRLPKVKFLAVCYDDPQSQTVYNEHILSLCHTAALNTWDKIKKLGRNQELERKIESHTKVRQGPKELFSDF